MGQVVAFNIQGVINWSYFSWGLAGIFFVLVAVELFNEYFDAKEGGDRIFSQEKVTIHKYFYSLGILFLALALIVCVYLVLQTGWSVLLFSFLGFLGAYFYVGPPIRWAYRGFGEIVIGLCYGPFMVLGSYYIQAQTLDFVPFFVSILMGLSIFCLAVLNEIPDYYQDMLVGKRNLVVRLGKQKAVALLQLCLAGVFMFLTLGVAMKIVPLFALAAIGTLPFLFKSITCIKANKDNPKAYLSAVNMVVVSHIVIALSLGIAFFKG